MVIITLNFWEASTKVRSEARQPGADAAAEAWVPFASTARKTTRRLEF